MIKKNFNVLVVEDFDLVSRSICFEMEAHPRYQFTISTAFTFTEAKNKLNKRSYDLVLLDYVLKDDLLKKTQYGDELIKLIREKCINSKIIIISKIDKLDILVYLIKKLKVSAYILKSRTSLTEMHLAINIVVEGKVYLSPRISRLLEYENTFLNIDSIDKKLLDYASRGIREKQMPAELIKDGFKSISLSAIEKRIKHLRDKFEVNSIHGLVSMALRQGIIE